MTTNIDWSIIHYGLEYYKNLGYIYVDVPWVVESSISKMTFPDDGVVSNIGSLVGSGEQGFLVDDYPTGKYITVTPCFRKENVFNDITRPWFMKAELYSQDLFPDYHVMVDDAFNFMSRYCSCQKIETDEGVDIVSNGIELGSYGVRKFHQKQWVYGTGFALPRLTIAKK